MAPWKRVGSGGAAVVTVVGLAVVALVSGVALWAILVALVCFSLALLLARDTRQSKARNDVRVATWWQIPATVTQSELRSISLGEVRRRELASKEAGFERPRAFSDVEPQYLADVRYEYVVGVQRFVGDRVGVSEDLTRAGATAIVARYAPGDRVTAWVDPSEPSTAVLDPSQVYTTVRAMWGLLGVLVAVGVLSLAFGAGVIDVQLNQLDGR
jgi:hypothetical protein